MEYNEQLKKQPPQRGKKYRKNLIDLLIILLVVVSVVSFFFRGRLEELMTQAMASDRATIGFVIVEADQNMVDALETGELLYLEDESFGEIGYIEASDAEKIIFRSTENPDTTRIDEFVRITDTTKMKISGTLTAVGARKDSGFYINGKNKVAAGMTIELSNKNRNFSVLITRVD